MHLFAFVTWGEKKIVRPPLTVMHGHTFDRIRDSCRISVNNNEPENGILGSSERVQLFGVSNSTRFELEQVSANVVNRECIFVSQ